MGVSSRVLVALLAAAVSACLVPQSVDSNDTRQHTVPVIDLASLPPYFMAPTNPLYKQAQDDRTQQCRCQLQLVIPVVTDDDPTIDLQARWYVDYDLGTPPSQLPAAVPTDLPGSFSQPGLSRGGVAFDIDADALAPGIHVIELVVAEKQGFAPDNANVILPHRSLLLGFDGTTLKIVVEVKPSNASQCDRNAPLRSPPLIRICPQ